MPASTSISWSCPAAAAFELIAQTHRHIPVTEADTISFLSLKAGVAQGAFEPLQAAPADETDRSGGEAEPGGEVAVRHRLRFVEQQPDDLPAARRQRRHRLAQD